MIYAKGVGEVSAVVAAVSWFEQLISGRLTASIALIAIAIFGISMLRGHFSPRNGARVIVGAFVLFGAHSIAVGVIGGLGSQTARSVAPASDRGEVPASTPQFDPYAGAAVPTGG